MYPRFSDRVIKHSLHLERVLKSTAAKEPSRITREGNYRETIDIYIYIYRSTMNISAKRRTGYLF